MSKFDNIRKIIKTHKKRIHIVYSVIFLLVLMFVGLYIQNYKINTKNEIKSDLEQVKEIYENENKTKDERIKQLEELNIQYNNYLDSLPFGSPVKDIIIRSDFGYRKDPFTKLRSFHYGVDLHTSYREPIISSGNGKVVWSSWLSGYGYCVQMNYTQAKDLCVSTT